MSAFVPDWWEKIRGGKATKRSLKSLGKGRGGSATAAPQGSEKDKMLEIMSQQVCKVTQSASSDSGRRKIRGKKRRKGGRGKRVEDEIAAILRSRHQ